MRRDCIVVGAGFAGLTAAAILRREGIDVLCLEARRRVGGRTEAATLSGLTIDAGGMWLGPTQTRLATLARDFQVRTYPTPLSGSARVRLQSAIVDVDGEALHEALPQDAIQDFARALAEIAALSEAIDVLAPWAHNDATALDALTLAHWMERLGLHTDVRTLLELVCRSVLCAEPSEVSLLFFLFYMKGGGGIETMIAASEGGAQNFLFEGGVHQIARRLGDELGDRLRLDEPVRGIAWDDAGCVVEARTGRHSARRAILALPPGPLLDIGFAPPLPTRKRSLLKRQPMGSCIKVWLAYARPFWRDAGRNGFTLDAHARFSPTFDATPPNATNGVLCGFLDADAAYRHLDETPEARRAAVLSELCDLFGPEAANPIDYVERDWTAEPFSQGCYGAFMGPGTMSKLGSALREPIGPIHWAGSETATIWAGYIEGAIQSGERAASEVLAALR